MLLTPPHPQLNFDPLPFLPIPLFPPNPPDLPPLHPDLLLEPEQVRVEQQRVPADVEAAGEGDLPVQGAGGGEEEGTQERAEETG